MNTGPIAMDKLRSMFAARGAEQEYEPLERDSGEDELDAELLQNNEVSFSWLEYVIFMLLGTAMLWAWNMFLVAAPYFQLRFEADDWILKHFQSAIISVSAVGNLGSMLILTKLQSKASYPKRIISSLLINLVVSALLALSTVTMTDISTGSYLAFTLVMVFCASLATGLCQNGAFAFAASFSRPEYMQAIMAGQGIAGVLPSVASIISVLSVAKAGESEPSEDFETASPERSIAVSAFIFFLTATAISAATLAAFVPLLRRHNRLVESKMMESITSVEQAQRAQRHAIGFVALYKKLHWLAASVFMCFAVTMFYPVFSSTILSVRPFGPERLYSPEIFIPLGFLFWNTGDLLGRLASPVPSSVTRYPHLLFIISLARIGFLPLYMLCNIRGEGAVVRSDVFYLVVVQLGFGLTNGWLGSQCMMGAGQYVEEGEREAAGGFMGLNLVAGLTVGSLLSFVAAST